jgi:flagellar biosynthetic protein FliQ
MEEQLIIDIFRETIFVSLTMMAVIIIPGILVAFVVSFFQAATQINDISLSFIPKIIITLICLIIFAPWLMKTISDFTETLINEIPYLIG